MRRRYQKGSLRKHQGFWVARWREGGKRKAETVGQISHLTKTQAQSRLAAIVGPINNKRDQPSEEKIFTDYSPTSSSTSICRSIVESGSARLQ